MRPPRLPFSWSKHHVGLCYSLFYAGQYVLLGVQLPFFAGWLDSRGFVAQEIGFITGAALIARLAFAPLIAFWADHQHDERIALRLVSFVFAAAATGLLLAPGKATVGAAAAMVIWAFGVLTPLSDSAVLRADRNGWLHYGQTRAAGSGFFLATTIVGGAALSRLGVEAAAWAMALAAVFAFLMSLALPEGAGARGGARPVSWREAPRLMANPVFVGVLLAAGLTQGAHAVYYAFSYLRWAELGYSELTIGLLWATGVAAEIVLLARARGLARRFGAKALLAVGAGGAALRWAATAAEPPLAILFLVQTMHALTFACAYLGAIEFLDRAAPLRLINTGMTLMSTTGVGAITGLATVLAGLAWDARGAAAAYLMMAAMGAGALVAALAAGRAWDGGRLFD